MNYVNFFHQWHIVILSVLFCLFLFHSIIWFYSLKSVYHFLLQSFLLHVYLHTHMPSYKNRGSSCSLSMYKKVFMTVSEIQMSKDLVILSCYFILKFKFAISEWLYSEGKFASHWQFLLKYSFLNSLLESVSLTGWYSQCS